MHSTFICKIDDRTSTHLPFFSQLSPKFERALVRYFTIVTFIMTKKQVKMEGNKNWLTIYLLHFAIINATVALCVI